MAVAVQLRYSYLGRLRQGDLLSFFLYILFIAIKGLNVMLKSPIDAGIFSGNGVGTDTQLSHLQFVDNTLLLCEKSWGSIRALKANLIMFELIFGLKIIFVRVCWWELMWQSCLSLS